MRSDDNGLLLGWRKPPHGGFQEPVWDRDNEGHLVSIAPTGAGKGVSCIVPALITWEGPAIVVDPKGENYAITARPRRDSGQQVYVLDPFASTDAGETDRLNPLDLIEEGGVYDTALMVASLLYHPRGRKSIDAYWDERATALIVEAIACAVEKQGRDFASLVDVRLLLETYAEAGDRKMSDFNPVGFGSERTRTSILSTAFSHLSVTRDERVEAALVKSSIDLNDVNSGKPMTIYIVIPPEKLSSHGSLLRVWLGVLMASLSRRRRRPERSTLVLVDEAAQLGELDILRTMITLMRSYGVRVWTFWQDISQLKRIYPDDWESLLNNSTTQMFFGAATPYARAQLSGYLCDSLPKPLSALKPDEMALVQTGVPPCVLRRPSYLGDGLFSGRCDENPFFGREDPPKPRRTAAFPKPRECECQAGDLSPSLASFMRQPSTQPNRMTPKMAWADMKPIAIDSVLLYVSDVDKAADWYQTLLNFKRAENGWPKAQNIVTLAGPYSRITLRNGNVERPGYVGIAMDASHNDILDALVRNNMTLHAGPFAREHDEYGLRMAHVIKDPDGNIIELLSRPLERE